jgi:DsbC/DsbD-like thiol-disulfide interchange protein
MVTIMSVAIQAGSPYTAGMIMGRILTIVAATLIWFPGGQAAQAQDASGWDAHPHSAVRLIAGSLSKTSDASFLRAGVEIKLDPGWKTYWRDPGDSGVPPEFDFSKSGNVKSVTVLWPAPERFPDGAGGNSIGYLDHVVLPLRIVPENPAKQTSLQLKLGYDICGNMCVPVEANLGLPLGADGAEESTIEKAEIRVPRRVALGPGNGLAILSVHREPGDAHERVVVEVGAPAGAPVDLFAEGPTPDWSLPLPEAAAGGGTTRHFTFDLDGLPPDAHAQGAMLTLTAVSGDDAIEVSTHLD